MGTAFACHMGWHDRAGPSVVFSGMPSRASFSLVVLVLLSSVGCDSTDPQVALHALGASRNLSATVGEQVSMSWSFIEFPGERYSGCGQEAWHVIVSHTLTTDTGLSLDELSHCASEATPAEDCVALDATGWLDHPTPYSIARYSDFDGVVTAVVTCDADTAARVELCVTVGGPNHCESYTVTCGIGAPPPDGGMDASIDGAVDAGPDAAPDASPDAAPDADAGCPHAGCIACESVMLTSGFASICTDGGGCGELVNTGCEGRSFIFERTGATYRVSATTTGAITSTSAGTLDATSTEVTDVPADTDVTMMLTGGGELQVRMSGDVVTLHNFAP